VNKACSLKSKEEKVEFLKKHSSRPLRDILKLMYDKSLKFNIPNTPPPYTPSEMPDSHGMLYREARKLTYFVKGFDGDNLDKIRREALFIQMLEAVDPEDAKLLVAMLAQKPLKGLTAAVLNEAFPNLVPTKS
jgi:hypothetical protein